MAKIIYVDPSKCTGCRTCELVCSIKNEGIVNPSLARIQVIAFKGQGIRVPMTCQQCEDSICSSVCPVGALRRDNKMGVVKHNKKKCIGCKLCVSTCPFGGINFNVKSREIFKCEQCDGSPQCIRFCEDKAITYIEADAVAAKKRRQTAQNLSPILESTSSRKG